MAAGGRLEAGWRHHLRIYSFLANRAAWELSRQAGGRLEADWRQAGGMLEAGWRQAGGIT